VNGVAAVDHPNPWAAPTVQPNDFWLPPTTSSQPQLATTTMMTTQPGMGAMPPMVSAAGSGNSTPQQFR